MYINKNLNIILILLILIFIPIDSNSQRRGGSRTNANKNKSDASTEQIEENIETTDSDENRKGWKFVENKKNTVYASFVGNRLHLIINKGNNLIEEAHDNIQAEELKDLKEKIFQKIRTEDTYAFYFHVSILNIINLDDFIPKKVFYASSDGLSYEIITLNDPSTKQNKYYIEYRNNLFIEVARDLELTIDLFYKRKFSKGEIKIISLVTNSKTNEIAKKLFDKRLLSFDYSSEKKFISILSKHKFKTIFILGHIENNIFITHDASGKNIFQISLNKLQEISHEHKINIFPIGCNSGFSYDSGILNEFNSLEAVKLLEKGIRKKYLSGIINELSSDNLKILINQETFEDLDYSKYKKMLIIKEISGNVVTIALVFSFFEYPEKELTKTGLKEQKKGKNKIIIALVIFSLTISSFFSLIGLLTQHGRFRKLKIFLILFIATMIIYFLIEFPQIMNMIRNFLSR